MLLRHCYKSKFEIRTLVVLYGLVFGTHSEAMKGKKNLKMFGFAISDGVSRRLSCRRGIDVEPNNSHQLAIARTVKPYSRNLTSWNFINHTATRVDCYIWKDSLRGLATKHAVSNIHVRTFAHPQDDITSYKSSMKY